MRFSSRHTLDTPLPPALSRPLLRALSVSVLSPSQYKKICYLFSRYFIKPASCYHTHTLSLSLSLSLSRNHRRVDLRSHRMGVLLFPAPPSTWRGTHSQKSSFCIVTLHREIYFSLNKKFTKSVYIYLARHSFSNVFCIVTFTACTGALTLFVFFFCFFFLRIPGH